MIMTFEEAKKKSCACVYKLDFPNGKSYVGMTHDLGGRMGLYERTVLMGKTGQVMDALREFGFDSVVVSILCEPKNLQKDDMQLSLSVLEIKYIREFNTLSPNGYNVSIGGEILNIPADCISTVHNNAPYAGGCKPILVYDLDGNFVREFDSIEQCAYHFGVDSDQVSRNVGNRRELFFNKYMLRQKRYGVVPQSILPFKREVIEKKVVNKVYEDKVIVREKVVSPRYTVLKYDADGNFCGEYDTITDAAMSIGRSYVRKGVLTKGYVFIDYDGGEIKQNIGKISRVRRLPKYSDALDSSNSEEVASVSTERSWGSLINDFKIDQFTLQGEIVATYDSINRASYETGIPYPAIWANVFGRTKSGKGFIWRKHKD